MAESRVLQLKRPVLLVSCPEQAMTVYGGLLGFRENYRLEHETRTFSHRAFRLPQDLETTFITLDLGDAVALDGPGRDDAAVAGPSERGVCDRARALPQRSSEERLEAWERRQFVCEVGELRSVALREPAIERGTQPRGQRGARQGTGQLRKRDLG